MRQFFDRTLISMAFAIFSMFFGAGNAIFPLILGIEAQDQFNWAFFGLLLTAIGGPLLGLLGATLFHGKCIGFFHQAGKIPGTALLVITMALLGPFAVLPRCVTVSYAAFASFVPSVPLWVFAVAFCTAALLCCWKQRYILPALGYVLSPALIGCLLLIIFKGNTSVADPASNGLRPWGAFRMGLSTGYDTMDLIAAIYFSSGIWAIVSHKIKDAPAMIFKMTLKGGILGCLLLAMVYLGLARAAANHSAVLADVAPEALITQLAQHVLGPVLGAVANLAVALACLTTVVSLTMTLSRLLSDEIWKKDDAYSYSVIVMLMITAVMANLGFETMMRIIHPVVSVCYPFIIMLTCVNIYQKLVHRRALRKAT